MSQSHQWATTANTIPSTTTTTTTMATTSTTSTTTGGGGGGGGFALQWEYFSSSMYLFMPIIGIGLNTYVLYKLRKIARFFPLDKAGSNVGISLTLPGQIHSVLRHPVPFHVK
jgi:hypothetical protein